MDTIELRRYRAVDGRVPYSEWLQHLNVAASGRVSVYVDRMKSGNYGKSEPVGRGVSELKINFGPGYRVYYIRDGQTVVILLCGGDKSCQQEDIGRAHAFADDYRRRK